MVVPSSGNKVLVQWMVVLMLIAVVGGAKAVDICNIDSDNLGQCLPAVSGKSPRWPTKECCSVIRRADLPCLCSYKSVLPAFGIVPAQAMKLPAKCGLKNPPQCQVA